MRKLLMTMTLLALVASPAAIAQTGNQPNGASPRSGPLPAPVGPNYLSPANSASPTNSFSREREQAVETRYRVVDYCGEVHLYPPIAMIDP